MKRTLIINELKFVEEILDTGVVPEEITPNMLITYLTRYYYEKLQAPSSSYMIDVVCKKMKDFHFDVLWYQEYQAASRIKKIYNDLKNKKIKPLRNIDSIPLYKSEYDQIMSCETDREKKFLFTMYILARFTDIYGWVYIPERDIYSLANTSKNKNNDIVYDLIKAEKIKTPHKVDDIKIGVNLSDQDEKIIFEIDDMKHLGNKFMAFIKDNKRVCQICGKSITNKNMSGGRPPKYCDKCAKKMELEKYRKYNKKRKNNHLN